MKKQLRRLSALLLTVCIGILLVSCAENVTPPSGEVPPSSEAQPTPEVTTEKDPEAVPEYQARSILKDSYDTIEIVSHDTDWANLIDTFIFKGQVNYPYMITETIGTIAFKFDKNSNNWQRYQDVEQEISYEEEWLLSGEWQCNVKYGDEYANFSIDISSYDGEVAQCSFNFEGNCYLEEVHTISQEGSFTLLPVPGDWNEGELRVINKDAKYIRLISYGDDPSGASYAIIFDRKQGVILHILNLRCYFYWIYLDKVSL